MGLQIAGIRTATAARQIAMPGVVPDRRLRPVRARRLGGRDRRLARALVHHYPCDHFDVWPGHDWFDKAAADQVAFLGRVLSISSSPIHRKSPRP